MIEITFCEQNGRLSGFEISGHSGFAETGSDIVCAAVSSCAQMVANTLTEILALPQDQVKEANGYLRVKADSAEAQPILQGFLLHCRELEKLYPQNIHCQIKKYSIKIRRCNNNAEH